MDFDTLTLYYYVSFGKGDSSESMDWKVDLNDEQAAAYKRAVMTGTEIEEVEELSGVLDEVYEELKEQEEENALHAEDEYAMECLGEKEMDADELNDLVHDGDEHAIKFFGLENLSEDELQEWDANELDELPKMKDFDEDFEPCSPFDQGWSLVVKAPEGEPEDEDLEEYIEEQLSLNDIELVETVVSVWEDSYSGDLQKKALEIAENVGCSDYIEKHKND